MDNHPQLTMTEGPQPSQSFALDKSLITLGRDPNNDIVINDPQVSRKHARITRQEDLIVLEDLGSTNGTFVNGMRLTSPHALSNSDTIGLGDAVTLVFQGPAIATTEPLSHKPTISLAHPEYEPSPPPSPPPPSYESPPSYSPPPPSPPPVEEKKSRTGLWIGCGCLVLLLVVACVAVFVLDYLRLLPPIFYEPLRWLGFI